MPQKFFKQTNEIFIFEVIVHSKDNTNSDYSLNVLRKRRVFNYNGHDLLELNFGSFYKSVTLFSFRAHKGNL